MATYYIDLGLNTSGHAGTESDPFSWQDATLNFYDKSIYKVKGIYIYNGSENPFPVLSIYHTVLLEQWLPNEIFVFDITTTELQSNLRCYTFKGVYIEFKSIQASHNLLMGLQQSQTFNTLVNSIIKYPDTIDFENSGWFNKFNYIAGSTLINTKQIPAGIGNGFNMGDERTFYMRDSIIDDTIISNFDRLHGNNCLFSHTTFIDPHIIDCQFNWDPPVWPSYTHDKTYWHESLFPGINTPPQPGNPPYFWDTRNVGDCTYNTGPWGETRTGIGALHFGSPPPPSTTPRISEPDIIFSRILMAFASELERFEEKITNVKREAIPGLSRELLSDWETDLNLPDECTPLVSSEDERAQVAHAKFTGFYSGQSKQFFIDFAEKLGATIRVKEHTGVSSVFRVDVNRVDRMPGSGTPEERIAGSRLWSSDLPFKWIIYIDSVFGNVSIEQIKCRIRKLIPAHTELIFIE